MTNYPIFVLTSPGSSQLYAGHYDPLLVALSLVLAIFASFAALQASQQAATATTTAKKLWITVGGLCMGAGVWSMHFVGMLALSLPCSTSYDPKATILSMIPGIIAGIIAMTIVSRPVITKSQLAVGGLLLGIGIGTMH